MSGLFRLMGSVAATPVHAQAFGSLCILILILTSGFAIIRRKCLSITMHSVILPVPDSHQQGVVQECTVVITVQLVSEVTCCLLASPHALAVPGMLGIVVQYRRYRPVQE
eukprot:GHUV01053127.1.p3 GENE.GHUV01053127.1~~GHUV01053127.1.p3  ORF type:complete len:110 (+),score=17.59 GHUV01053127.1:442-771(+)